MLLNLTGRTVAYDLIGPDTAPVVCMTHSLASDSGMWAEQVPALLRAGFRVLRVDMRGHGGSAPVAGDYTMSELAWDVAETLDVLGIQRVHFIGLSIGGMLGQAFALEHHAKLASAMWCDTLPASPAGASEVWQQRVDTVRNANSLVPLADPTIERWLTDAVKTQRSGRWKQIRDTIIGTTPQGYLGCVAAIRNFNFLDRLPMLRVPVLVVCGADDAGTPATENKRIASVIPGARYEEIANARHFPNVEHPDTFNRIMVEWLNARMRG
jgi:3-oxoadipate enol-lactonase